MVAEAVATYTLTPGSADRSLCTNFFIYYSQEVAQVNGRGGAQVSQSLINVIAVGILTRQT